MAAFRRDNPDAEVHLYDTGHFALETHATEIASAMQDFSKDVGRVKVLAVIGFMILNTHFISAQTQLCSFERVTNFVWRSGPNQLGRPDLTSSSELSLEIATPDEACKLRALKGADKVAL